MKCPKRADLVYIELSIFILNFNRVHALFDILDLLGNCIYAYSVHKHVYYKYIKHIANVYIKHNMFFNKKGYYLI